MEKFPDNQYIFENAWTHKANQWINKIRTSGIPDEYCQELEIIIEKMFLDGYIKSPSKNDNEIIVFTESVESIIEKIPDYFMEAKQKMYEIIINDIRLLKITKYN